MLCRPRWPRSVSGRRELSDFDTDVGTHVRRWYSPARSHHLHLVHHPQRRADIQQARDNERKTGESVGLNLIRGERRRDKNKGVRLGPDEARGDADGGFEETRSAKVGTVSAVAAQGQVRSTAAAAAPTTPPPSLWFMGGGGATDSAPIRVPQRTVVDMRSMTADGLLAMA